MIVASRTGLAELMSGPDDERDHLVEVVERLQAEGWEVLTEMMLSPP